MPSFLVCGEALWDMFAEETGDGLAFKAFIGGSPFNVAVGLARLGNRSALLTGLSDDSMGQRLKQALVREGVETDHIVDTKAKTTLSLVDVDDTGGPAYAFYGEGAADRQVTAEDLPNRDVGFSGLHFGSYSLVVEPVGSSLLKLAQREAGTRMITVDPNVRLNVEPDLDLWRERVAAFVAAADLVKVSTEDFELLYPGMSPDELAVDWRAAGAELVIVTNGSKGATAFYSGGTVHVDAATVDVIDTVGAGDSFMAATIGGLLDKHVTGRVGLQSLNADVLDKLLTRATRAAAITCSRRGADLPRGADLV